MRSGETMRPLKCFGHEIWGNNEAFRIKGREIWENMGLGKWSWMHREEVTTDRQRDGKNRNSYTKRCSNLRCWCTADFAHTGQSRTLFSLFATESKPAFSMSEVDGQSRSQLSLGNSSDGRSRQSVHLTLFFFPNFFQNATRQWKLKTRFCFWYLWLQGEVSQNAYFFTVRIVRNYHNLDRTHTHTHLSLIHIWRCRRWP